MSDCFRVGREEADARLDRFLAGHLPGAPRARVQAWIEAGLVRVDGAVVRKAARPVRPGQEVRVDDPPEAASGSWTEGPALAVVLEDPDVLVLDKPAGLLSHANAARGEPGLAELADRLYGPLPREAGERAEGERPGLVHRLDRGTSGLVLLARTPAALAALKDQFRAREVDKRYLALVHGEPRFDTSWIEAALGRREGSGDRWSVVPAGEGRPASTYYEVRERLRGFALLECAPVTGRTHQLRVHLQHEGHPIVGDAVYKPRGGLRVPLPPEAPRLARQALHAARLAFRHPGTGQRIELESPLPDDLRALLEFLRERARG